MSSTTTRSQIGSDDIKWWDGVTRTFTRRTSTGGNLTLNSINHMVDVVETYGSGDGYTSATLINAVTSIGNTNKVALLMQPGTWTIDANVTVSSNMIMVCPPGVSLNISNGITLVVNGSIQAGSYQIFTLTGTGVVNFAAGTAIDSSWFATLGAAIDCIGSTQLELNITKDETLSADDTISANTKLIFQHGNILTVATGITLTVNGKIDAGLHQIFSLAGTGVVVFGDGAIEQAYPEWWGAKGDNSTDCTTAIQAAINACKSGTVRFGYGKYLVTAPLTHKSNLLGTGRNGGTVIKAKAGWSGALMLDFYNSDAYREGLKISGIYWDANSLVNNILGSSNDGVGNAAGHIEDCVFINSVTTAVYSTTAVTSAPGAFTGTTWVNCYWTGNAGDFFFGVNQDDVKLVNCRVDCTANSGRVPMSISGANFTWDGGFIIFGNLYSDGGIKPLIKVLSTATAQFNDIFAETNSSDITHVVYFSSTQCNASFNDWYIRVDDSAQSAGLLAFARANIESWVGARYPQIFLKNIYADYDAPSWKLLDLFVGAVAGSNDVMSLQIEGCDGFGIPFFQYGAASGTVTRDSIRITGTHRGKKWQHSFNQTPGSSYPKAQQVYTDHGGLVTYNYTADSASGTSPRTTTVTLPSEGQWLVSVQALNGDADKNHMASALYKVEYNDETTNDLLDSELLGTSQTTGGALTPSAVSLGNPTDAGVITATATWTGGGSYVTRFVFRCRKLSNYTLNYDY